MLWPFSPGRFGRNSLVGIAIAAALASALAPATSRAQAQARRRPAQATIAVPPPEDDQAPGSMKLAPDAKVDPRVEPAQLPDPAPAALDAAARPAAAEADEVNPLPGAKPAPGGATAPSDPAPPAEGDGFAMPLDRMSMGKQEFRLSVEIQQPGTIINLGRETALNLVVRNQGTVEALGVSVVWKMPEGLKLVSSTPEAKPVPGAPGSYFWGKPSLAINGEWVIPVKIKATQVMACDLGLQVTGKAGARARLLVQEPKLKVEQMAEPTRLLKGRQAKFRITVSNPGTGPARNVLVQAKLGEGLRTVDGDNTVEQTIPVVQPGVPVELDTLVVDTRAGGMQACEVVVSSADVTTSDRADTHSAKAIEVISPDLKVKLGGPETRVTDQKGVYTLTVENPGTAPAENVKLVVTMPTTGGRMTDVGDDLGQFDKATRKLFWNVGRIEAKDKKDFNFTYQTTGPGLYTTLAEATAGELRSTARLRTEVRGLAVLDLRMTRSSPVIDVGDATDFEIEITNRGTEDATKIILGGTISTNMEIQDITGIDAEVKRYKDGRFTFPEIAHLPPGETLNLTIRAKAVGRGSGTCRVQLGHAALPKGEKPSDDDLLHGIATTTITGDGPARAADAQP